VRWRQADAGDCEDPPPRSFTLAEGLRQTDQRHTNIPGQWAGAS
jgi:hypothetical protein